MSPARRSPIFGLAMALFLAAFPSGAGAADAPQSAAHKTTQSVSYVGLDPIYATILDGTRPRGLLLVEFGLDVPDAPFRDSVNRAMPNLRDAYVRALMIYAATAVRPWRQPSVEDIAKRMQVITDRMMGHTGARVLMAQTAIRLTR
jgi:hypothetical protein